MANRKISDLTALTAPVTGDLLPIVDISEAAAADKNKKITYGTFLSSVPLGTAAAPSIAFTGDTNTGIYSPGADQLAISTDGTGRLYINASGNVGVGNSAPSFVLDVSGGAGTGIRYQNTANSIGNILGADSSSGHLGTTTAHPLSFITGSTEKARIDTSGRLLVGTSTAVAGSSAKLQCSTTVNLGSVATYADNTAATVGGLAVGDVYKTALGVLMIRF